MAEKEDGRRVWLIADNHHDAVAAIRGLLEERGDSVEILDLTEAIEGLLRDRGGQLLDNLKGLWRRASGSENASPDEAAEEVEGPLAEALGRGKPDLIAITSPRFLKAIDWVSKAAGGEALLVALLPDYNLSEAWLKGAVHAYVIPHEGLRVPLEEVGIDSERIFVGGPAIARVYAEAHDAEALRADFGLDAEQGPVSLVHCVGFDDSDLDRLVFQLSLVDQPWQPIFYAGANPGAAEILRRAARTHGLPARMLGEVPNLHDFVAASDLVIAHPGDDLLIGALALDRPILLIGDPGPVTTQCDFLTAQGAAMHVKDMLRVSAEAELAITPERLTQMVEASTKVGRRTGTAEVADAFSMIFENRASLEGSPPKPGEDNDPKFKGPFELIGAPPSQRTSKRPEQNPQAPAGPFETLGDDTNRPAQAPAPTASPLSAAAAKDQLASLIMQERDLERKLEEARRDRQRWHDRLELAREWNEQDLAKEAETILSRAVNDLEHSQEQLDRVRVQKEKLKARVRKGQPASDRRDFPAFPPARPPQAAEGRYKDMEIEDDLSRLKRRLQDELDS